ncbi:MAG: methyltransferase domain-containing protein [Conexivisphaerales archaeon]|jgi:2-polyprenyl-6-hydroxyphenyl methylase/3-demethylubiquinone-9 3-methyltransferase
MAVNKRTTTDYFDEQSATYYEKHYGKVFRDPSRYPVLYLRHKYVLEMLQGSEEGRAIDIGCGSGAMLIDLWKKGFEVVGVDISTSMVRRIHASSHSSSEEPLLGVTDLEHMPFIDKSFDVVVCNGVVEYLARDDLALREISRILKTRGVAFVSITNALAPMWFLETMAKALGVHGRIVSLVSGGAAFPRARLHVPAALSDIAARVGLVETGRAYFHFSPFPFPLNEIFPLLSRRLGLKMEALSKRRLGFLGRGCIVRFVKMN